MGYEQIGGGKVYRPWAGWTEGDVFEGVFRGTSEDNYGKTNWEFETVAFEFEEEVAEVTAKKTGKTTEYAAPKVGDIFVLNSCGSLDNAMEKVDEGDKVKVIYEGTVILNKGPNKGAEAHSMKIFREPKVRKAQAAKESVATEVDMDDVL